MDLRELKEEILTGRSGNTTVEQLATTWLALPPKAASRELFSLLRNYPREYLVATCLPLLSELAARSEHWDLLIRKSYSKRGRCPHPFRGMLQQLVWSRAKKDAPLNSIDTTEPLFGQTDEATSYGSTRSDDLIADHSPQRLQLTTRSTRIDGCAQELIRKLSGLRPDRRSRVLHIDVAGCDHLYIFGLAMVAVRARAVGFQSVQLHHTTLPTYEYITEMGLNDYLADRPVEIDRTHDALSLQRIRPVDKADVLARRIISICDKHGYLGSGDRNALLVLLAETIENVQRHSESNGNACIAAQYYPKQRKISIVVADAGIGILRSFKTGYNVRIRAEVQDDLSAIDCSMRPLVTSKPVDSTREKGHAGYGLYVVSELAFRNGGTFGLTSGTSTVHRYRRFYGEQWRRQRQVYQHSEWSGTMLSVLLDLKNLLDIKEVYRALPVPKGYEAEDFFDA